MHASNSTAAIAAAAIAAVESVSECLAGVRLTACTVNVDCAGVVAVGIPLVEPGTVVEGVLVAPPEVAGAVAVGGTVVVGTDMAGVVVVVPDVLVVAPEVEGFAVVGCTLADAGIGKVGVELVGAAICR
jgi:hypothetical protein